MSNWSQRDVATLKDMVFAGAKNANIATALGKTVDEIYAKRSQLDITMEKIKDFNAAICDCCGAVCVAGENTYTMPDDTDAAFCSRCTLTIDYVNSFDDADTENTLDEGEQTDY